MSVWLFCLLMIATVALSFFGVLLSVRFVLKGQVSVTYMSAVNAAVLGAISLLGLGTLGFLTETPIADALLVWVLGLAALMISDKMNSSLRFLPFLGACMVSCFLLSGFSFWSVTAAFFWVGFIGLMRTCDTAPGLGIFLPLAWTFGLWVMSQASFLPEILQSFSLLFFGALLAIYQVNKILLGASRLLPKASVLTGYFYGLFFALMWSNQAFMPVLGNTIYPLFEIVLSVFLCWYHHQPVVVDGSTFMITKSLAKATRPQAVWRVLFVRVVLLICLGIFATTFEARQLFVFLFGMMIILVETYQRLMHWGEPKVGYKALWKDLKGGIVNLTSQVHDLSEKVREKREEKQTQIGIASSSQVKQKARKKTHS